MPDILEQVRAALRDVVSPDEKIVVDAALLIACRDEIHRLRTASGQERASTQRVA